MSVRRLHPLWLALLVAVSGGGPAPALDRISVVDVDDFPQVDVVVEFSQGLGELTTHPSAADVTLLENEGKGPVAAERIRFRDLDEGVAVAVLVDVSGSMRGEPLETVRRGLRDAVKRARPQDRVVLASVADDLRWESQWDSDADDVRRAIDSLEARGSRTRLWDATHQAAKELTSTDKPSEFPQRRRILIVSDGHDEGSADITLDGLIELLRLLDPVLVVDAIAITAADDRYAGELGSLAVETGGSAQEADDNASLQRLIERGVDRVLDTPVYRFESERLKPDGEIAGVALRVLDQEPLDELQVRLPKLTVYELYSRRFGPWIWAAAGLVVLLPAALLMRRRNPAPPGPAPAPRIYQEPQALAPTPPRAPTKPARTPTEAVGFGGVIPSLPAPFEESASSYGKPLPIRREPTRFPAGEPGGPGTALLLTVKEPGAAAKTLRVDAADFRIGAALENQLSLPDDPTLSGEHACIVRSDSRYRVFDLGSTNGSWVNGKRLGPDGAELRVGDVLRVGAVEIMVSYGGA